MQIQISLLLDRTRADTLTTQLTGQLRDAIRLGRIAPGARLPSSRRLSEQLGIGRNTVVRAYELLEMECCVETRPASGIFALAPPADRRGAGGAEAPAPRAAVRLPSGAVAARGRLSFDFVPGRPAAALFPLKIWRRAMQTCLRQEGGAGLTQPVDLFGLATLRAAIAAQLAASRGIIAEPGQIVIVSGMAEAIALACRLFVTPGSVVCVENPCYRAAADAFRAAGGVLHRIAVDDGGLVAEELPDRAAVLYVTPSHQYPTGHMLSQSRRALIAARVRQSGCIILEDDHGADFRYEGGTPAAIAALAPDHTLYAGTFSQALGSGLRMGYLVVPAGLVDAVRAAKALLNSGCPWLEQAIVAEMIRGGSYASHLVRMRAEYRQRRDALLGALRRNFGDVEVSGESGGLHIFWQLPPGVPDAATVEALGRRARVGVYGLDSGAVHHAGPGALARRGLILGYATMTPGQIEQGIARLSDAVDDALDGHRIDLGDLLTHRPSASSRPAPGSLRRRPAEPVPRNRQQPALPAGLPHRAASGVRASQGPHRAMPVVTQLYHYPIKGLSPQPMQTVRVEAGKPFPFDRLFALARPGVAVTAEQPKWAKKGLFVMLMLDEGLASVRTVLNTETLELTAARGHEIVLKADLGDANGRRLAEDFFYRLAPTLRGAPVLVRAGAGHGHFMDKPDNVISLINLQTLRGLEQQWGFPIDPLRFRANIYIDGAPAWEEFNWIGSDIRLGGGIYRADRRNGRCGATNVDPATGRRDLDIPGSLRKAFGHKDLGIYLIAANDSVLAIGDGLHAPGAAGASRPVPAVAAAGRSAFICRGCYYIYHDPQGPAQGPDMAFTDLPAAWRCPDCGTDKSAFRPHAAGP